MSLKSADSGKIVDALSDLKVGQHRREGLLQDLIAIQRAFHFVPPEAVSYLSKELDLTKAEIQGVVTFYSFLHEEHRGAYEVLISNNITDQMLGNQEMLKRLCGQLGTTVDTVRADGRVSVSLTSCTGLCEQGPAALVNGLAITRLDPERIDAMAQLIESSVPVSQWPSAWFEIPDHVYRKSLLLNAPLLKGEAISACLKMGPESALAELDTSGLRGRGGAGFGTSTKWRYCRESPGDQRYVVCNADEGEPGTFKDRVLLNSYAHSVFEGMTICASLIGAQQGFLYLRGEYLHLKEPLEKVLSERRNKGLLGKNILGHSGVDFDIEIHLGAGAYICGEESALIESLEGKRGIPRNRPPFPVSHGYMQQPTVVNNVETFMAAALITLNGSEWFRSQGTPDSAGTKLLSISGDCQRPGVYEYAFGTPISQILQDCGAETTQAVQISGAAGTTHPAAEFDRKIAFEDVPTAGSFMVFDESRELLDMVQNFADFFVHESCGFCTPCRVGGSLLRDLVAKVRNGYASQYDLQEMRRIGHLMEQTSHCGLGSSAYQNVRDTLDKFSPVYDLCLVSRDFVPAFELDQALASTRQLSGRNDTHAHLENDHD